MSDEETEGNVVTVLTDRVLVERMSRGDVASFETLFYRHYDRVYGLLFRLLGNRAEAEDVTQEVFLKLYRQPLKDQREHNLSAWLYRVATNMGYNQIRGRRRLWQRNTHLIPDSSDAPADPADEAILQENREAVRAALAQLPKRHIQLLILRQMGLSYVELAEVCDVAPGSIGKLLSRAADAFRKAYQQEWERRQKGS